MSHPFASFYRGKRVLVTGHTGFTGGWLVAWLKLLGARVFGYGLPPSSRPNFFDAILLDRGITSVFADVRDRETLSNTFADFQPEVIFHAAAQSQPGHDSLDPFSVNVSGTLNVLEETRLTACLRVVVLLSESRFPAPRCAPLVNGSQASTDWLRATHAAAEVSALAFADSFFRESGTAVGVAGLPGLVGGGDWAESRFVPNLLRNLGSGEPIVFRNGLGRYAHVLDAARACLHLAENLYTSRPAISGGWDFPAADHGEISEQDLAERFIKHWPGESAHRELFHQSAAEPIAPKSPDHAKVYPGWTCTLSLDEAIAWTMDWYKGYSADPASAWRMTEAQIEQYAKLPRSWTVITADHWQAD